MNIVELFEHSNLCGKSLENQYLYPYVHTPLVVYSYYCQFLPFSVLTISVFTDIRK